MMLGWFLVGDCFASLVPRHPLLLPQLTDLIAGSGASYEKSRSLEISSRTICSSSSVILLSSEGISVRASSAVSQQRVAVRVQISLVCFVS